MNTKTIFHFLVPVIVLLNLSAVGADWVGTWGASPQAIGGFFSTPPPPPGLTNNTLRQVVHVSIGGNKLRVKFSNEFGKTPLTIDAAHVALSTGGSSIDTNSDTPLAFDGKTSCTIPAGGSAWSDAADFTLAPMADLAVTIHFGDVPASPTYHLSAMCTSYLLAGDAVSAADLSGAAQPQSWYILEGVDVQSDNARGAIVAFGDSITDGIGSDNNQNTRWPDDLARRLQADPATANIGVINEGISGNCILRDGAGLSALSRFDQDAISQSGARWIILLEGVNDIGASRDDSVATNLIAAYQKLIARAHAHNIRIYAATITPFGGSFYARGGHEDAWQTVNKWIRTSGQFDAVIDFDAAVRDPQNPSQMSAAAGSRDHLHPGASGYQTMADAIDLNLFKK